MNIKEVNNIGFLVSTCFLNDNNIYIITSNKNNTNLLENIKIFDLNGNKAKEIENSNNSILFIDTYYDNNLSTIYIINGNNGFSQSYDYNKNKKYFKYNENNNEDNFNMSIIMDDTEKKVKMIESSCRDINKLLI